MERISYLISLGEKVVEERTKKKMNQVDFYRYLFPDSDKEDETIKKKMNKIENAKQRSIDFEFVNVLCEKCDLSIDYLFGRQTEFKNHQSEFVNSYTGLSANSIEQLHEWKKNLEDNVNTRILTDGYWHTGESDIDPDDLFDRAHKKKEAQHFIEIINYLFEDGEYKNNKKNEKYSNLSILYSIYDMCISKPKRIMGDSEYSQAERQAFLSEDQTVSNFVKPFGDGLIMICDNEEVWRPVNSRDLIIQLAKNRLDKQLDRLIEHINSRQAE